MKDTETRSPSVPTEATETTRTISDLVDEVGSINSRAHLLQSDASDVHQRTKQLHQETLERLLRENASTAANRSAVELSEQLSDYGFAWRHIADLVGVSIPALRKWRQGEAVSPPNKMALATLVAFCELLVDRGLITDPASWLERPLMVGTSISGLDLYAEGRMDLLFPLALHHDSDPKTTLDEFRPGWQERQDSDLEVFVDDDGRPSLRERK